jgi:hypothetical protein
MADTKLRSYRRLTFGMAYAKEGKAMVENATKSFSATWVGILALALFFCPLAMEGQSVTLAWNPSISPGVIGYLVYYGTDGTNFDSEMDAGSNTSATVSGLQSGATNYFEVVAYNVNRLESPPSNLIQYTVPAAPQTVTVLANPANAGNVTGGGTFATGTAVAVTATANSGYTFATWSENGIVQSTSPNFNFTLAANCNLVANFTANLVTYTVTSSAGNNGSISPTGPQTVVTGGNITFTAAPANNYQVNQWLVNGTVAQSGGAAYTLQDVTTNNAVAVTFSANPATTSNSLLTVTVLANPTNAGNVTGGGSFVAGSSLTVTATANSGYTFSNWTGNGNVQSTSTNYSFALAADCNLVANFTTNLVNYTVTPSAGSNGSISPTGPQTVVTGGNITFTAAPANNYQVNQWLLNGLVVQSGGSAYALQDVTTNNDVAVTFSANPTTPTNSVPPVIVQTNSNPTTPTNSVPPVTVQTNSNPTTPTNSVPPVIVQTNSNPTTPTNSVPPVIVQTNSNPTTPTNSVPPVIVQTNSNPATTSNSLSSVTVQTNANTNFSLLISGDGTIVPNLNDKKFQEGKKYILTAIPARGSVFSNWVSNGIVATTAPRYTILVESNVVLQANFIPNPFLPVVGLYHGLFYVSNDASVESSGAFVADVTSDGFYTANIRLGGDSYSFSGDFSLAGAASKSIRRAGLSPITVQLQLGSTNGPMTGTISASNWTADLVAEHAVYSSIHPAPEAGKYTLLFPGSDDASAQPGGNGFVTATVYNSGLVLFSGTLGDGTAVSSSSTVCSQGQWPFYVSLYGGKGSILGWLSFTNSGDIGGQISWFKQPEKVAKLYPGGFTNNTEAIGSVYHHTNGVPVLGFTDGLLSLINGDLTQGITNQFGIGPETLATDQSGDKLTFNTLSGLFRGSVLDPETGKTISVNGVVLQNQNLGAGYFLGTNESGSVLLSPAQ